MMDNIIFSELVKALNYLVIAGIVYLIYKHTKEFSQKHNYKKVILESFLFCILIAGTTTFTLGNGTCLIREYDSFGTTCVEYAENDYQPSEDKQVATFLFFFTLLFVPAFLGAFSEK